MLPADRGPSSLRLFGLTWKVLTRMLPNLSIETRTRQARARVVLEGAAFTLIGGFIDHGSYRPMPD